MLMRYVAALALTILLLGVARRISTRHPADYSVEAGGITLSHRTVTEDFGDGPKINIEATSTEGLTSVVYYSLIEGGPYTTDSLSRMPDGFSVTLPVLEKGNRWYYHIKVSQAEKEIAKFPPGPDQFIKFKGHVPAYILIPHIFCMFATIFFGLLTVFTSISVVRGKAVIRQSVRYLLWTVIFAFIGGFPLGYIVAYLAFGQGWGGIPIGWDITDNKTVILFLFWLVTLILTRGGLKGDRMAISKKAYMSLAITSFIVTVLAFIIPHSI
jgi:hypothetical protein